MVNNNIKIINVLTLLMLFLFLLGQGVWIYHVRELKVKEFKMRAGYLLSEVAEE